MYRQEFRAVERNLSELEDEKSQFWFNGTVSKRGNIPRFRV